jgi:hypothetical protein
LLRAELHGYNPEVSRAFNARTAGATLVTKIRTWNHQKKRRDLCRRKNRFDPECVR